MDLESAINRKMSYQCFWLGEVKGTETDIDEPLYVLDVVLLNELQEGEIFFELTQLVRNLEFSRQIGAIRVFRRRICLQDEVLGVRLTRTLQRILEIKD